MEDREQVCRAEDALREARALWRATRILALVTLALVVGTSLWGVL